MELDKLIENGVKSIKRLLMVSGINNPYKQFTFTIADGMVETVYYDFNYFRILNVSTTSGVTIRFGSSGTPTDVVGAGIGYEMPAVVNRAEIINNSGGALTITVGVAIGRIDDDRLNVSGAISVAVPTVLTDTADVTLDDNTGSAVQILAADSSRASAQITNLHPTDSVRIGTLANVSATRGRRLHAGETITLETTAQIAGISETANTVDVSAIETEA